MIQAICTHWPDLDPLAVSAWPWYRTAFYVEWLGEIAKAAAAEVDDERPAGPPGTLTGVQGLEALAGFGANVREVR